MIVLPCICALFHVKWNFSPFTRRQILFITEIISCGLGYGVGLGMVEGTLLYLDTSFKNSVAA